MTKMIQCPPTFVLFDALGAGFYTFYFRFHRQANTGCGLAALEEALIWR